MRGDGVLRGAKAVMQPQPEARRSLSLSRAGELLQRRLGSPVGGLVSTANFDCACGWSPVEMSQLPAGDTSLGVNRGHARVG